MSTRLVVDAANVVGSRPDGWWRDRPGAARRLAVRIVGALSGGCADEPLPGTFGGAFGEVAAVYLVLEGAARAALVPTHPGLVVVHAPADGDAAIAALAAELGGGGDPVLVVTADRGLRARVREAGAEVLGPGRFLATLPPARPWSGDGEI